MKFADLLLDRRRRHFLCARLAHAFGHMGVIRSVAEDLSSAVLTYADAESDLMVLERQLKAMLCGPEFSNGLLKAFRQRSQLIFEQIQSYVQGPRVLDLGCGDGRVGQMLAGIGFNVELMDIIDYRDPDVRLPFVRNDPSGQLPSQSENYDSVLLLTVLHHAENPVELLAEALRVCRRRVVVIESVYGVRSEDVRADDPVSREFSDLGSCQWQYAAFMDWFYNRVLHDEVPVPLNFKTPDQWITLFRKLGAHQIKTIHLGIDQPLVPEYHTLHVLDRLNRLEFSEELVT